MLSYTKTPTYLRIVGDLKADIAGLEKATTAKHAAVSSKDRQRMKATLKTRQKQLERVGTMAHFSFSEAVKILIEADGCAWTSRELDLWDRPTVKHEGRGEKSLRHRLGLPLDAVSTRPCDLFEINEEVKCLVSGDSDNIMPIRPGAEGERLCGQTLFKMTEEGVFKDLGDELRTAVAVREISPGKFYHDLPEAIRQKLLVAFLPSSVLGHYDAVNCTTAHGYIRVPKKDCDVAWRLACITQSSPRYRLSREYVEERLRSTGVRPTT